MNGDASSTVRATEAEPAARRLPLASSPASPPPLGDVIYGIGRIDASGIDGSLQTHTGNGRVTVAGRFDALDIDTGRGQVNATVLAGSKMSSDWRVGTGVGNVTVSLPPDFSAELDGSTGVGHVTVDFPVTVSGSFVGSSVRGRIGKGGAALRVHTGVGDVHIERSGS